MKICKKCGRSLPTASFYDHKFNIDGKCGECKECLIKRTRERNKKHFRKEMLRRKYGITEEQYTDLLIKQDYLCAICREPEVHKIASLSVDHDHKTGKVRGLLCYRCNTGLGKFKDDVRLVQIALDYLKENE